MLTYIVKHERCRMVVWLGLLMSLLNAGGPALPLHGLSMPAFIGLFVFLFQSAVRRRLITKITNLLAFPVF